MKTNTTDKTVYKGVKPIIWKEYDGAMHGFVGGLRLFSYQYNESSSSMERYRLFTKMMSLAPRTLPNREECENMAKAILQKFANQILE